MLVRCVRKVAAGETWLDKQGVNWVIEAYRTQALQGTAPQQQLRLSEKEMMIISGVTQGMKNKDIATEVGTTEQVVKNYLRKIYDKLHVADRLELALYSMHHRLLDGILSPYRDNLPEGGRTQVFLKHRAGDSSALTSWRCRQRPGMSRAYRSATSADLFLTRGCSLSPLAIVWCL